MQSDHNISVSNISHDLMRTVNTEHLGNFENVVAYKNNCLDHSLTFKTILSPFIVPIRIKIMAKIQNFLDGYEAR